MRTSKARQHRLVLFALPMLLLLGSPGGLGGLEARGAGPASLQTGRLLDGKRYTVTLLTGDVVTVDTVRAGCPQVSVKPAKPSGIQLRSCDAKGHVRVVPLEAAPLIGTVLDEALFDVTTLIREGYDDAGSKDLPLIVRQPAGVAARAGVTSLPSISAVAFRQPKGAGLGFAHGLRTQQVLTGTAGKEPLVRLDRRVRVTAYRDRLDHNLPQVSAPRAWSSGFDGRGVNVAVLDTGADFDHPDLVGQVVERADFTVAGGDAVDRHGHGTHVAATIAGSGAAAAGERKGVASGAKLVIGRVLDADGSGSESQVIAGMEWAASRAKVVNMSLGGWEPSDGTDPMSRAVDALSARHGTLFVVAAGNDGQDNYITSPAAAASALTVGAVDGNDAVADFSSRGPLTNTRAAKPDLVAPGVEIVAARAAGTAMGRVVDARYVAATGTSMASPHAAGGAAILAQRYPEWTPGQLKSALVGAVDPLPRADVYTSGAGRLNVARALTGAVSDQAIVHLGVLPHPQTGTVETKLAWRNTSARLRFEVTAADRTGGRLPEGAVAFNGGKLTVDRARLAGLAGSFAAVVTARTPDGALVSTTPVTFFLEPLSFDLTLTATAPPGTPAGTFPLGFVNIVNLDDPAVFADGVNVDPAGDPVTVRVPAGRYSVMGTIFNFDVQVVAMLGDPDLTISADTSLVIDAARAKPVSARIDGVDTVTTQKGLTYRQTAKRGWYWFDWASAWGEEANGDSVFAGPVSGAGVGTFEFYASYGLQAPGGGPSPFIYHVARDYGNGIPDRLATTFTRAEQSRFIRIDQRFHRLDQNGSSTIHKRYGVSPTGLFILEEDTTDLADRRTDYLSPGFRYVDEAFYEVNGERIGAIEARRQYQPGSRHDMVWVRQPLRPDWYDDPDPSSSGCVPQPIRRTREQLRVQLVELADQHQRFHCFGLDDRAERRLALHRDGVPVDEFSRSYGEFTIPAAPATYRLSFDLDAKGALEVSSRISTAWTFRSEAPKGTGDAPLALLSVDYALALDSGNHPGGGRSGFIVRQAHGVAAQHITSFTLSASLDDGVTWQPVAVRRDAGDRFSAELPRPGAGQAVSLRLKAEGSAGSAIEQTIIRAYR